MTNKLRRPVRGIEFEQYPLAIGAGQILSRNDFVEVMQKSYSTVVYHLERAVKAGLLNKQYGYIVEQPGWLYALPETMPRLEGM